MTNLRVIVIGAGLAGLAAARALRDRNYEVLILEARNRSGGRILTKHCADLGAHWINGTEGNPITDLARQYGLEMRFVGGDSTYRGGWAAMQPHREKSGPMTQEDKWTSILAADRYRDALEFVRREAVRTGRSDFSMAEAFKEAMPYVRRTTNLLYDDLPWHSTLFARDDAGAQPEALSALYFEEGYEAYGQGDSVFVDGYASLVAKLMDNLNIRYGEVVTDIEHSPNAGGKTLIRTRKGEFRADRVVVTLPLGVLKSGRVRFNPPLPEVKIQAMNRLGVATVGKLFLYFKEPFWDTDQYAFSYINSRPSFEATHVISLWKTQGIPCLQIQVGGDPGRWLEACTDADAVGWGRRFLGLCFGRDIPAATRVLRSNWSGDEFSLGAYSYIKVGGKPDDIGILSEPIGDWLYFAGEATNPAQWGSTHGAYTSGLREAARISRDFSILPVRPFSETRRQRSMVLRSSRFFNQQMRITDEVAIRKRLQVLSNTPIFKTVSSKDLRLLASMFEEKRFAAGEIICRQGDKADEVFVVAEGKIEVRLGIQRTAIDIVGIRAVVGEYGLFTDARRNATLVASEPTLLLSLNYDRFERFLLAFPESNLQLFKQTVQRFMAQQQVLLNRGSAQK